MITVEVKGAVLYGPKNICLEGLSMPIVRDDEVLVKVKSVGICGSDMHFYHAGRIGSRVIKKPLILGHECSGEVVKTGKNVSNLREGDKVALEPGIPCRKCEYCKEGRYNLCEEVAFMGAPPTNGAFVEYLSRPADFTYRIPESVGFDEAALIEPLAVGIHATRRGEVKPGDSVLILGGGPIGLLVLQMSKVRGAGNIIVSDTLPNRLNLAKKFGATEMINVSSEDIREKVMDLTGGKGAKVVFEAAGVQTTVEQSVELVQKGGRVVFVGQPMEDVIPLNMTKVIRGELNMKGLLRYANVYPQAIELISKGLVDLGSMITHDFPLLHIKEALEFSINRKDISIKTLVRVG